jgi:hypothetical protein
MNSGHVVLLLLDAVEDIPAHCAFHHPGEHLFESLAIMILGRGAGLDQSVERRRGRGAMELKRRGVCQSRMTGPSAAKTMLSNS